MAYPQKVDAGKRALKSISFEKVDENQERQDSLPLSLSLIALHQENNILLYLIESLETTKNH